MIYEYSEMLVAVLKIPSDPVITRLQCTFRNDVILQKFINNEFADQLFSELTKIAKSGPDNYDGSYYNEWVIVNEKEQAIFLLKYK